MPTRSFTEPTIITDPEITKRLIEMITAPITQEAIDRNKRRHEWLLSVRAGTPEGTIGKIVERF